MAYEFGQNETVRDAVLRSAREQLDRAVEALRAEIAEDPVEAVHTARKAIKKERALLRLARGTLPSARRSAENIRLRDVGRTLSGLRDADVMVQTVTHLSERFAGQLPASAFADARECVIRSNSHAASDTAALTDVAAEELIELRVRTEDWKIRADGWRVIRVGLRRTYRQGRKAFRMARADPSTELLHAWRKRVKDHWYHLRLLTGVCGPIVGGAAEEADRLSDILGDDHDLGVLNGVLSEADVKAVNADPLLSLIDHYRAELQAEAWQIGRRLYAEKPTHFERRLYRLWKAGQLPRKLRSEIA